MSTVILLLCGTLSFGQHYFINDVEWMYGALADSVKLRSYFHEDAIISHIEEDTTYSFTLDQFLGICPKFKSGKFREEIVKVDTLTSFYGVHTAEIYFKFYLNGEFSHCGVDHITWVQKEGNFAIERLYSYVTPCLEEKPTFGPDPNLDVSTVLNNLMDKWHRDVAEYNFDAYFNFMDESFIFLGTDPRERWSKAEFKAFSEPYFEKESTWDFKPLWRNWYFSEDGETAWFEEQLETWMEECRGSGVLRKIDGKWKIVHYNLTVLIENEKIKKFIKLRKK